MSRLSKILQQGEDQPAATLALKADSSSLQASLYRKPARSIVAAFPIVPRSHPATVSPFLPPAALALGNAACCSVQEQGSCTALVPLLVAVALVAALLYATTDREVNLSTAFSEAYNHLKWAWDCYCWYCDQANHLKKSATQLFARLGSLGFSIWTAFYFLKKKNRSQEGALAYLKRRVSEEQFDMLQQCLRWLERHSTPETDASPETSA